MPTRNAHGIIHITVLPCLPARLMPSKFHKYSGPIHYEPTWMCFLYSSFLEIQHERQKILEIQDWKPLHSNPCLMFSVNINDVLMYSFLHIYLQLRMDNLRFPAYEFLINVNNTVLAMLLNMPHLTAVFNKYRLAKCPIY